MDEKSVRAALRKKGYKLVSGWFIPAIGGTISGEIVKERRFSVVDENNLLIGGEFTMTLDEVAKWAE